MLSTKDQKLMNCCVCYLLIILPIFTNKSLNICANWFILDKIDSVFSSFLTQF